LGQVSRLLLDQCLDGAGRQCDGAVWVSAPATAVDHRQSAPQPVEGSALTSGQRGHISGDRWQPEHARAALASTGVRLEFE
jgi:hypothetical protein